MMDLQASRRPGAVIIARFITTRVNKQGARVEHLREVFGEVLRVTPKRILVRTLRRGFASFSKRDVWVPRFAATFCLASTKQRARWDEAMIECDALARAMRDAHRDEH